MKRALQLLAFCSLVVTIFPAWAGDATGGATNLETIQQQITDYEKENPDAFEAVDAVRAGVPSMDAHKRGPLAVVSPAFRALGDDALLPMLEVLLEDPKLKAKNPKTARRALRVGLLQAVGELRDETSRPVLKHVLETDDDRAVVRAAAEAIGLLGGDADVEYLLRQAKGSDQRAKAVLSGLGTARTSAVANHLAAELSKESGEERAIILIETLADVGNALAWQTRSVRKMGDGDDVRNTAAEALLDAYIRLDGELRTEARKALLVVDAPETESLISARKKGASKATAGALDELLRKVRKNPLRRLRQ